MDLFLSFVSTTPLGQLTEACLGAVHLARHHVVKRLNLGQVNDGLGVFVCLHRTVTTEGSVVSQIAVQYEKLMD